jgi:hypothetical protein
VLTAAARERVRRDTTVLRHASMFEAANEMVVSEAGCDRFGVGVRIHFLTAPAYCRIKSVRTEVRESTGFQRLSRMAQPLPRLLRFSYASCRDRKACRGLRA